MHKVDQAREDFCEGPEVWRCHLVCVAITHLTIEQKSSQGMNRCSCSMIKLYLQRGVEARFGLRAKFRQPPTCRISAVTDGRSMAAVD